MVDVVLVILIFFMASAALVGPEFLLEALTPPIEPADETTAARDGPTLPTARFEIELGRAGGATVVDGLGLAGASITELGGAARSLAAQILGTDAVVLIRADDGVPYADVVRARDACAEAGLRRVALE